MIVNAVEKCVLCFPLGVTPNEVEITPKSKPSKLYNVLYTWHFVSTLITEKSRFSDICSI